MEREKLESMLIDYIDGKLSGEERGVIEKAIADDVKVSHLYDQFREVIQAMESSSALQPSERLRLGFDQILNEEIRRSGETKTVFLKPVFYRIAAAIAFFVVAGGIGFWISEQRRHSAEMLAMKNEVERTKQLMLRMLDNQQSASQRFMGATAAFNDYEKADDEIVNALIRTMNEDENTNVRIAALEALGKFHRQPHVRKALIAALTTQKDPLVQIALIRLMVEMKEPGIKSELERITTDEEILPAVKDEAHAGLLRLS